MTNQEFWKKVHFDKVVTILMILIIIVIIAAFTLVVSATRDYLEAAPIEFIGDKYFDAGVVCAGDIISWPSELKIKRAPAMAIRIRTVWSNDGGRTVIPERYPVYLAWANKDTIERVDSMVVPDLPQGTYTIRVMLAALAPAGGADNLEIDFVIEKGGCEK